MNNLLTVQQTKDAYRDAASLMLNLFRDDTASIAAIVEANSKDIYNLLSGVIAIAAMITQKAFQEESIPALEALVSYLANIDEAEWVSLRDGARQV